MASFSPTSMVLIYAFQHEALVADPFETRIWIILHYIRTYISDTYLGRCPADTVLPSLEAVIGAALNKVTR